MVAVEMIAGRQLLKLIHIAHLKVEPFCKLIAHSNKEPVLVKKVVGDLLSCIDMNFIVECEKYCVRFYIGPVYRYHQVQKIPKPKIKIRPILEFVLGNFSVKTFFYSNPLLGMQSFISGGPKYLLP